MCVSPPRALWGLGLKFHRLHHHLISLAFLHIFVLSSVFGRFFFRFSRELARSFEPVPMLGIPVVTRYCGSLTFKKK